MKVIKKIKSFLFDKRDGMFPDLCGACHVYKTFCIAKTDDECWKIKN